MGDGMHPNDSFSDQNQSKIFRRITNDNEVEEVKMIEPPTIDITRDSDDSIDNKTNEPLFQIENENVVTEELTSEGSTKIVATLINKYEQSDTSNRSSEIDKIGRYDSNPGQTIYIKNHEYYFINNGLFLLNYTQPRINDELYASSTSFNMLDPKRNELLDNPDSNTYSNMCHTCVVNKTEGFLPNVDENIREIFNICQTYDIIRIIIRCESEDFNEDEVNYMCIIDDQTMKNSVVLGLTIDKLHQLHIGLLLDYQNIETVEIVGDGCIHLVLKHEHAKSIKISSVQNFWRTLQYLPHRSNNIDKKQISSNNMDNTHNNNNIYGATLTKSQSYIGSLSRFNSTLSTHIDHYHKMLTKNDRIIYLWNRNDFHTSELVIDTLMETDDGKRDVKRTLSRHLVNIMSVPNVGELTMKYINTELRKYISDDLTPYKCFIGRETIRIYGQMENATQILSYLYLGSDHNACDINFIKLHNITYVLNVTKEINNFYMGILKYLNVCIYDVPDANLLASFDQCYKYIELARIHGTNILVHCHMGVSRSASVVIAYLIKKFKYSFDEAFNFVKQRRSFIRPNSGFIKQLHIYAGMVHHKRDNFRNDDLLHIEESNPNDLSHSLPNNEETPQ